MKILKLLLKVFWHTFAVIGILSIAAVIYFEHRGLTINIGPSHMHNLSIRTELLRQANDYETDTFQFNIHSIADSVKAKEIREYFNLDSILGSSSSTWDRTLMLAQFVARSIPHANQVTEPEKKNAIALWEYVRNVEPAFNCRMHSILLFELLNASDISATFITCMPKDSAEQDCHVVNQVWLPELNKWAMIDSDSGGNYATDESGTPLSLAEIRDSYITGKTIYYHKAFSAASDEVDWYYAYMAKNTYWFSSWETIQFDQEPGRMNPNPGKYIHLVPKDFLPYGAGFHAGDIITSDAQQFWARPSNL